MVIRHHEEQRQKEERARREEQAKLRRIASTMAKDVRQFWSNVEKVRSEVGQKEMALPKLEGGMLIGLTRVYQGTQHCNSSSL